MEKKLKSIHISDFCYCCCKGLACLFLRFSVGSVKSLLSSQPRRYKSAIWNCVSYKVNKWFYYTEMWASINTKALSNTRRHLLLINGSLMTPSLWPQRSSYAIFWPSTFEWVAYMAAESMVACLCPYSVYCWHLRMSTVHKAKAGGSISLQLVDLFQENQDFHFC